MVNVLLGSLCSVGCLEVLQTLLRLGLGTTNLVDGVAGVSLMGILLVSILHAVDVALAVTHRVDVSLVRVLHLAVLLPWLQSRHVTLRVHLAGTVGCGGEDIIGCI